MTQASYMAGRKRWQRPQAMLWSDSSGTLVYKNPSNPSLGSIYVPSGYEINSDKNVSSIISTTGSVSGITGSGPWTGIITTGTFCPTIQPGWTFTAINGTGSIGSSGTYSVLAVLNDYNFTFTATGGTTPTTGTITDINFFCNITAVTGSGPWTVTLTNVPDIQNVLVGSNITATSVTGSIGTGGTYIVQTVNVAANSLTFIATGGTLPTLGTIKSVSIVPTQTMLDNSFLILSDHNRSEINISPQRIEQRQRMVNGGMRSYHIADKINITTSWSLLPSRSFAYSPEFNQTTGQSIYHDENVLQYTADNGAGGVDMLSWYEEHKGPFWVFLSYDKYSNYGNDSSAYLHLAEYSQVIQMYISSFDYSIVKRGRFNYDMWNVSISLEEV